MDKFGVKNCLLLFISFITLGQAIFALGVSTNSWALMDLGNVIMGLGGESYTVANSALLSEWFNGAELAFAFGVNLSMAKLGSVINDLSSPQLAEKVNVVFAFWFGVFLCVTAITSIVLVFPIDLLVTRQTRQNRGVRYQLLEDSSSTRNEDETSNPITNQGSGKSLSSSSLSKSEGGSTHDIERYSAASASSLTEAEPAASQPTVSLRDVFRFQFIFWILVASNFAIYGCVLPFNNISSSLLLERDYFKEPDSQCALTNPLHCPSNQNLPNQFCPTSKWYQPPIPLNYTSTYPSLSTNDIDCTDNYWKSACATSMYCDRLTKAESMSSVVMSIPYIISAVLSPVFGFFIDRFGMRAVIATIAPMILIVVHALLGFTTITPVSLLVGQGLAYTGFASVLWPSVPIVVEERMTGLGFGIVMSVNNLASAIVPIIISQIYEMSDDKYIPNVELLFVSLGVLGVLLGLYMNWFDFHHNNILNGHWLCSRRQGLTESNSS